MLGGHARASTGKADRLWQTYGKALYRGAIRERGVPREYCAERPRPAD